MRQDAVRGAVDAVKARNLGDDPVAVRAALEEELAARGLTDENPYLLERATRILVASQGPFASLRMTHELWKLVAEMGTGIRKIVALVREGDLPEWLKPPPGRKVRIQTRDNAFEAREVELAAGVQPLLARAYDALDYPELEEDEEFARAYAARYPDSDAGEDNGEEEQDSVFCKVWVDTRRLPEAGTPLPVILGTDLIGTLVGENALVLQDEIRQAKNGEPLILEAEIAPEGDRFEVWVIVPASA